MDTEVKRRERKNKEYLRSRVTYLQKRVSQLQDELRASGLDSNTRNKLRAQLKSMKDNLRKSRNKLTANVSVDTNILRNTKMTKVSQLYRQEELSAKVSRARHAEIQARDAYKKLQEELESAPTEAKRKAISNKMAKLKLSMSPSDAKRLESTPSRTMRPRGTGGSGGKVPRGRVLENKLSAWLYDQPNDLISTKKEVDNISKEINKAKKAKDFDRAEALDKEWDAIIEHTKQVEEAVREHLKNGGDLESFTAKNLPAKLRKVPTSKILKSSAPKASAKNASTKNGRLAVLRPKSQEDREGYNARAMSKNRKASDNDYVSVTKDHGDVVDYIYDNSGILYSDDDFNNATASEKKKMEDFNNKAIIEAVKFVKGGGDVKKFTTKNLSPELRSKAPAKTATKSPAKTATKSPAKTATKSPAKGGKPDPMINPATGKKYNRTTVNKLIKETTEALKKGRPGTKIEGQRKADLKRYKAILKKLSSATTASLSVSDRFFLDTRSQVIAGSYDSLDVHDAIPGVTYKMLSQALKSEGIKNATVENLYMDFEEGDTTASTKGVENLLAENYDEKTIDTLGHGADQALIVAVLYLSGVINPKQVTKAVGSKRASLILK